MLGTAAAEAPSCSPAHALPNGHVHLVLHCCEISPVSLQHILLVVHTGVTWFLFLTNEGTLIMPQSSDFYNMISSEDSSVSFCHIFAMYFLPVLMPWALNSPNTRAIGQWVWFKPHSHSSSVYGTCKNPKKAPVNSFIYILIFNKICALQCTFYLQGSLPLCKY